LRRSRSPPPSLVPWRTAPSLNRRPVVEQATVTSGQDTTQSQATPGTSTTDAVEAQAVQQAPIVQQGGAAGLVAAVVQAADTIDITDTNIEVVTIQLENSLNNLRALNNVLNNSPILSNNDIDIVITDVIEIGTIENLIAIGILEGGDLILFTRP